MKKMKRPYLIPKEAAKIARVTEPTVINWCIRYPELGVKVGGRWRISPVALQQVLDGTLESERRADEKNHVNAC